MAARFVDERSFEAPAPMLFALLRDPRFQEARSRHLGTLDARCTVVGDTVTLHEVRDTGWGAMRFESRMVTRWSEPRSGGRDGEWELVQTAGPGETTASGTLAIRDAGPSRCRLRVEGTIAIRAGRSAWLGRTIEQVAVRALRAARAKEARFTAVALARGGPP